MAGIRHKKSMVGPDNPEYEASSGEWNDEHNLIEYVDVIGGAAIPAAPAVGKARQYVRISGITPNRNIRIGWLLEDGTDIVLADVTI